MVDSGSDLFSESIYNLLGRLSNQFNPSDTSRDAERLASEYFSVLEVPAAIKVIYKGLLTENDSNLLDKLLTIIKTNDLVDYEQCRQMLRSDDLGKKKLALNVLSYDKPTYVSTDVYEIEELAELLKTAFPKTSTITTKKGFLSSGEKEVWMCGCSQTNQLDDKYCAKCFHAEYGFNHQMCSLAMLLQIL